MTKQAAPVADGSPVAPVRDVLPAGAPLPVSNLHFASPGFKEPSEPTDFAAMPESMPPPPTRPVLPPDSHIEADKPGLLARLLGGLTK